jgi:predicted amidohydrolase YtcJ
MLQTRPHTRRAFLGTGSAALALAPSRLWAGIVDRSATLILRGGRVHTLDPAQPLADSVAIGGSRILGVGTWAELKALAGPATTVIDLGGQAVVPGFIDCHNHAVGEVLAFEALVGNPFDVEFVTIDSIVAKLAERARAAPPGQWVEGFFYDDTKIKDGRGLTRQDLDRVSADHPVMVHHRGSHTAVVNSLALRLAGITRDTPDPFGGTYVRDDHGDLTGLVTDLATAPFEKVGQRPAYTPEQRAARARTGAARISSEFARYGLTTVHHDGLGDPTGAQLDAINAIRAEGKLLHRVRYEPGLANLDRLLAGGVATGFGDEWVRIGAISEQLSDGSFSERTMSRRTPYPGHTPPYYGNVTQTQAAMNALVERLFAARVQPNFHANGEVAVDMVLTALEAARARFPDAPSRRPKITHCTVVTPELVQRIRAAGAVPAMFTTYAYYNADKFAAYGPEMMDRAMAFRWMLDAGVPVAAGSDFPPGPIAPLMGLQGMVTRKGWNGQVWGAGQKLTVEQGLRVLTVNGAWAGFDEADKGTITPGKLADLVVLDRDPMTADPETIKDIRVTRTLTGGRTVHVS